MTISFSTNTSKEQKTTQQSGQCLPSPKVKTLWRHNKPPGRLEKEIKFIIWEEKCHQSIFPPLPSNAFHVLKSIAGI